MIITFKQEFFYSVILAAILSVFFVVGCSKSGGDSKDPEPEFKVPTVVTGSISSVTDNSAICGGNVTSDGGDSVIARGVVWNVSKNPTLESCAGSTVDGSGKGLFSSEMTGLSYSTVYYVRAYAVNSAGTSYGEQNSFTTEEQGEKPTVVTAEVTEVTKSSATCGGEVTSEGGGSVTVRGVVWGLSPNPTMASCVGKTTDGSGVGTFTSRLVGLTDYTLYYVRAYAVNSSGVAYGKQKNFTTGATSGAGEGNGKEEYEWQ